MSPMPDGVLPILRTAPHMSNVYLVIQQPEWRTPGAYPVWAGYLWSCQIDGEPTGDPMVSLTVDGGAAGPIALLDGMTVFIGSALGAWDYGMVRLRGDQTVGAATVTLDIGISSDLRGVVPDNAWVVVLDEFRLWQRYSYIDVSGDDIIWRKDWDILWNTLGANDVARRLAMIPPTPIMGPHAVKFVEPGGDVTFDFDWSDSHALAPGQAVTSWISVGETDHVGGVWNDNIENPAPQTYSVISGLAGFRVTLTVDDGNGVANNLRQRRGIRYVFTLRRPGQTQAGDPPNAEPITEFQCGNITGSFSQGYWRTTITVYGSQASEYQIIPGALVILFAEDWYYGRSAYLANYGANVGSVGPIQDRENILMVGVIARGTISQNSETGDVSFEVMSIAEQATITENIPMPITDDAALAYMDWIHTPGLTTDIAIRYYLAWQTTLANIADTYPTGDATPIVGVDFPNADIYSAVDGIVHQRLLARFLCDRFGRFTCVIDQQVRAPSTANTLWTLAYGDWVDQIQVVQQSEPVANIIEAGGIYYDTVLDTVTPYLSQAPGLFYRRRGSASAYNNLAVITQLEVNVACGRMLAYANNEFPELRLSLAGNWRVLDIWPQEYVIINLVTGRHEFVDVKFIPRQITMQYDPDVGAIFVSAMLEMEADGPPGVTIPIDDSIPNPVAIDPPRVDVSPTMPPAPPPIEDSGMRILATPIGVAVTDDIAATPVVWYLVNTSLPAGEVRCWALLADQHHWTVTGPRTLWGIFGAQNQYLYKMENFPIGTWVLKLSACDICWGYSTYPRLAAISTAYNVPNLMYAIMGERVSGISTFGWDSFLSTNDGENWIREAFIGNGDHSATANWPLLRTMLDTANNNINTVFALLDQFAASPFLFRSVDRCGAWTNIGTPGTGSMASQNGLRVAYHSDDNILYEHGVTTSVGGATVQRSVDGGAGWSGVGIATLRCYALDVYKDDRLKLAGIFSIGDLWDSILVYVSIDGGANWTQWANLTTLSGDATVTQPSPAGCFVWDSDGNLESVLVMSTTSGEFWEVTRPGGVPTVTDRTGNLGVLGIGSAAWIVADRIILP